MSSLKKFFLFCAGTDQTILEKAPSDVNKYMGIGATVFFTGVLAFFSSAYALFTVFDSYFMAIVFGMVWGLMIFNLDRYIVMSMKSQGKWWRDFGVAVPRLILAVFLAVVISKPLELKIFEKEINAELVQMEQEIFKEQEDKVNLRYEDAITNNENEIAFLKSEIEEKTRKRDTLSLMALQEADGTGGSGNKNLGPIYRAKKAQADNAQIELDGLLASHLPKIEEKETAIAEMKTKMSDEIAALDRTKYDGMAARMEALDRLTQGSAAIFWANVFIMLLFVSIETAPILVKLISSRSPYDFVLHEYEHEFKMANLERTSLLSNEIKNKLEFEHETGKHRTATRITTEKELVEHHLKEKLEDLKKQPLDWQKAIMGKSILG